MRSASLLLIAYAAIACGDDRYGLYITTEAQDIRFDRVELHFGRERDDEIPLGYGVAPLAGTQRLYEHDDFDDRVVAGGTTTATYYIPSKADIDGDYVLAIAHAQDRVVAVGELFDLELPAQDEVYAYTLPLEPLASDQVAVWGAQGRCYAWTRERSFGFSSVALVPDDDAECRKLRVAETCADLCTASSCDFVRCLTPQCGLGSCKHDEQLGAMCVPEICVSPNFCDPVQGCTPPTSTEIAGVAVDNHLYCAISKTTTAQDFRMQHTGQQYCLDELLITLPAGLSCNNPYIVFPPLPDLIVMPDPDNLARCRLTLPQEILVPTQEHVLIVLDSPNGQSTTITIGVHQGVFTTMCSGAGLIDADPVLTTYPVCNF